MRGKRSFSSADSASSGITPAGAGKTFTFKPIGYTAEDHPRRCGENGTFKQNAPMEEGSPPQVRGKPELMEIGLQSTRITPAGAGKTIAVNSLRSQVRDHPRRCGENSEVTRMNVFNLGSPPQVRGKLNPQRRIISSARITPAGAGKTARVDTSRF